LSSDLAFIEYICDQISGAGSINSRKMFGDYAIYCDGKVIALACDNQFFVKPTAGGRALIGTPTEAPPYPGAKPHFLIADALDDREWITELVRITAREVPLPKPKKPKARK
jgi:DNA transformation protein and related proteins